MAIAAILTAARKLTRKYLRSTGGNLTMVAALGSIPVIAAAGMAIDYARISRVHDEMQLVSDGATLAAAGARNLTGTSENKKTQRVAIATNYMTNSLAKLTDVDVVGTPTVVATTSDVTVSVHATVKGSFMNVLNALGSDAEIGSVGGANVDGTHGRSYGIRVTSKASWNEGMSLLCMLVLNTSAAQSLEIQGTADIIAPGCAVWVNSSSNSALYENGVASLTAKKICVNGNYYGSNYYPDMPKTGSGNCPVYADPLATKFATDYAAAWAAALTRPTQTPIGGTVTLQPGKYNGGITVNNGGRVTLAPGVFFIVDGTFNIKAGGEVIAPDGVSIIITKTNVSVPITDTSSKLTVLAQGNLTIKAPATGPFAGIAIAQHKNVITGTLKTNSNKILGGGAVNITGIVYYPTQFLYITGGGSGTVSSPEKIATTSPQFAIVADKVMIEGNGRLQVGGASDSEAAGLPALPSAGAGKTTISLK